MTCAPLPYQKVHTAAAELGIDTCLFFSPSLLIPELRIRAFCEDNRCGRFGKHHMCPPASGTIEETAERLGSYNNGILLQMIYPLDVRNDSEGVQRTKRDFHQKVLHLEALLRENENHAWGLIGGDCALCDPCFAVRDTPCPRTTEARPSLESLGVDVIGLLENRGLDTGFHPDRVTWTGCLLY